jgi:hypothetical protein
MRRTLYLLALLASCLAAASVYFWHELGRERTLNAELRARLDAAPAPVVAPVSAPVESMAPPLASAATTLPSELPPAAAEPSATPRASRRSGDKDDWQQRQRLALQDPRYRQAWREQSRLQYALRRDNIMRLLGLTQQQADAVVELQIDNELAMIEDPRPIYPQRYEAAESALQAKLRDLLGEQKAAALQSYMESRGSRMQVDQFRNQLSGADMLRDDQVEPLIAAMHVENTQLRRDLEDYRLAQDWNNASDDTRREFEERRAELTKEAHARMHDAAAPILSSSQLQKFDAMLARDRDRRAAKQRLEGLQVKIGGGQEPPAD